MKPTYEELEVRCTALAAENAGLKNAVAEVRRQAFNSRRNSHNCGPFQYSDLCESILDETNVETPATDAFLVEVRAQGVEMFANELGNVHKQLRSGSNHAHAIKSAVFRAVEFAAQLRKGGAA